MPPGRLGDAATPVPLLRFEGAMWDPVALETWREALSDLIRSEVSHELMALWLYLPEGEAALIGPLELAQDHLDVPRPTPRVPEEGLRHLEERVGRAGYHSVGAFPVPHGERDVGLLLVAGLDAGALEDGARGYVREVAAGLGPTLARVASQWGVEEEGVPAGTTPPYRRRFEPGRELHELRDLIDGMGHALGGTTGAEVLDGISAVLMPLIPHDLAELVVPGRRAGEWYRLGRDTGTPLANPELVVSGDRYDFHTLFGDDGRLLVEDGDTDPRAPVWPFDAAEAIRSVNGVRLGTPSSPAGYLLLGSQGPWLYREEDVLLLGQIGAVLAPRVRELVTGAQMATLQSNLGVLRKMPSHLGRVSELLATTAHVGAATRLFAQELSAVLPFARLELALTAGESGEVVVFGAGDTGPLRKLPVVDVSGTELHRVLRSEMAHSLVQGSAHAPGATPDAPSAALVVPLRVSGRVIGALTLVATGTDSYGPTDVVLVQQFADILSPHLELVRRAAFAPSGTGGWRRVGR